ncbi:unnamed protein product [Boreogadus saida]
MPVWRAGGAVKFQLWTPTKNSPAYLISGSLFTGGELSHPTQNRLTPPRTVSPHPELSHPTQNCLTQPVVASLSALTSPSRAQSHL